MRQSMWIFLCIVFISFLSRFFLLDSLPLSFQDEEAAWGVQANSVLQTGKDIFGQSFPIFWRLPESIHLPMYGYLTSVSVALFGLNEFAVRLPAAFFSALTPLVLFFLLRRVFKNIKIAIFSAAFLALSPWHIPLSRWGNESALLVFLLTLGLERFFGDTEKKKFPWWTVLCFALGLLTDMTAFLLVPLIAFSLVAIVKTSKIFRPWITASVALGIFSIFLFLLEPSLRQQTFEQSIFYEAQVSPFWGIWIFFRNLFSILSFQFLFFHGDERLIHGMNDIGLLFLGSLPIVLIGIFILYAKFRAQASILFLLLIGSAGVSALSRFVPDARTFLFGVIPLSAFFGLGFASIIDWSKRVWWRRTLVFCTILILGYNVLLAGHLYFGHYSKDAASQTQAVYKPMWAFIDQHMETYDHIVLSGRTQSNVYMHGLFFLKIDPGHFQTSGSKHGFDNFIFGDLSTERIPGRRILLIAEPDFIPGQGEEVAAFSLANGNNAFIAWDIQK